MGKNFDLLTKAVRSGDVADVERLLKRSPALVRETDRHGSTPLHHAAEVDQVLVARTLIALGAPVLHRAPWGHTPLAWAANCGALQTGRLIAEWGGGPPTLWDASGLGWADVVRHALEADEIDDALRHERFDRSDAGEWESLGLVEDDQELFSDCCYIAGRNGHIPVVALFLERGADIDFRGYFGGTALHWAAINGHESAVRYLVEQGADASVRDTRFDADPADWAREGGHHAIVRYLERVAA